MGIEKSATRGRNVAMRLEEGERREYSPAPASGGALVALGQPDQAAPVLDALDGILAGHGRLLPSDDRAALERFGKFIRARWWLLKGQPDGALPLLRDVVAQGTSPTEAAQSFEAWLLLGAFGLPAMNGTKRPPPTSRRLCSSRGRRPCGWPRRGLGPTLAAMTWPSDGASKPRPSMTPPRRGSFWPTPATGSNSACPKRNATGNPSAGPWQKLWRRPESTRS